MSRYPSLKKVQTFPKPANCPLWLDSFFLNEYKYLKSGGFKHIFSNGASAISVEIVVRPNRNRQEVYEILKKVPRPFSDHIIVPTKEFECEFTFENETMRVLFSLMSLCPYGDLFSKFTGDKYDITERQMLDLGMTLKYLHSIGVFISDLKAENIMHCTCDCLAFIDLDTCLPSSAFTYKDYTLNGEPVTIRTLTRRAVVTYWWNPMFLMIRNKNTILSDHCRFNDWFAFAICYMCHCAKTKSMSAKWEAQLVKQWGKGYDQLGDWSLMNLENEKLKQAMLLYNKGDLYYNQGIKYAFGVYKKFVATIETVV